MGQKDGVVLHCPGDAPGEAWFLTTGRVYMWRRLTWAYTGFSSVSVNCNPRVTNTLIWGGAPCQPVGPYEQGDERASAQLP